MPLSLRHINAQTKAATIPVPEEYGGGEIALTYRLGGITPEAVDKYADMPGMDGVECALSDWITAWDVEGEEGQPYPTDRASLRALPMPFLRWLFGAILADLRPNPPASGTSGDSSSLAG